MPRPTDFEMFGLSGGPAALTRRSLIVTIDFEAFRPAVVPAWINAMRRWAMRGREGEFRFCLFVALENVVQLREHSEALYSEFLLAIHELHEAGSVFHPHNHYLFDPETGLRPPPREDGAAQGPYSKRRSMFYDVVHRHGVHLGDWCRTLTEMHARFLREADVPWESRRVFRAGGWDYGSSRDDLELYIHALGDAGFDIDSSASAGTFGTPSWRAGARFGTNVFWLTPQLLEVAPTWSLDGGSSLASRAGADSLRSLLRQTALWNTAPGAFVPVLHFDHLLREAEGDAREVARRIDRSFSVLHKLRAALRLPSTTYEALDVGAPAPGLSESGGRR